jgi:hypothetical protein
MQISDAELYKYQGVSAHNSSMDKRRQLMKMDQHPICNAKIQVHMTQKRKSANLLFYCGHNGCFHVTNGGGLLCPVHNLTDRKKWNIVNEKVDSCATAEPGDGCVKDYLSMCDDRYINSGKKGHVYPAGPLTYHWMKLEVGFEGAKGDNDVKITEMSDTDLLKFDRSCFSKGGFARVGETTYAVMIKKAASSMLTSENGRRLTKEQEQGQWSCLDPEKRLVLEAVQSLMATGPNGSYVSEAGFCAPVYVRHFYKEAARLSKNISDGKKCRAKSVEYINAVLSLCNEKKLSVKRVCNDLMGCDFSLAVSKEPDLESLRREAFTLTHAQISLPVGVAGVIYQNGALFGVENHEQFLRICQGIQPDAYNLKRGVASSQRSLTGEQVASAISKSITKLFDVLPQWHVDQAHIAVLLGHRESRLDMKSLASFEKSLRSQSALDETTKNAFEAIGPRNYYAWLVCTYMNCDVHWKPQKESLEKLMGTSKRSRRKDKVEGAFLCVSMCGMNSGLFDDIDLMQKECDEDGANLLQAKTFSADHVKMCKLLIKLHSSLVNCATISKYDSVCGVKVAPNADTTMDRFASVLTYAQARSDCDVDLEIGDMNFLSREIMSVVDDVTGGSVKSKFASYMEQVSVINTEKFASALFHPSNITYLHGSSTVVPRKLIEKRWLGVNVQRFKFLQRTKNIQCIAINPASLIGTFFLHSDRDADVLERNGVRNVSAAGKMARFFNRVKHYTI